MSATTPVHAGDGEEAAPRARINHALSAWRLSLIAGWTLYSHLVHLRARFTTRDPAERRRRAALYTHRWLAGIARCAGIGVTTIGVPPSGAVLITPNHTGYLDIMAVGAATPTMFVSKADVKHWPIIGHLFNTSEHIGIARADRRNVAAANENIAARFAAGVPVCVFLEGTTSSGERVMPFHASLVQSAINCGIPVLPVGLCWSADAPGTSLVEDIAYWRTEHTLVPHLWRVLGLRGVSVTILFGNLIPPGEADRKVLAAQARDQVVKLVEAGRPVK
jgi:1-acyl-sn-glycerol-3-phosphate acyltransferase